VVFVYTQCHADLAGVKGMYFQPIAIIAIRSDKTFWGGFRLDWRVAAGYIRRSEGLPQPGKPLRNPPPSLRHRR
jgi:hypothetical protein